MIILISFLSLALSLKVDPNTFSNYQDVQAKNVYVEWLLDLNAKTFNGTVRHTFLVINPITYIDLDVYQLRVDYAYLPNGRILQHQINVINQQTLVQGDQLRIQLDRQYKKGEQIVLLIRFGLDQRARALGFLNPSQTVSKFPYVFSQCETNNCRSMLPIQDTPSIKFLFSATAVTRDPNISVFITGQEVKNLPTIHQYGQGYYLFQFYLDIPITAYLIGIVAGNLVEKPVGDKGNIFVISEPQVIQPYLDELVELPLFLSTLEDYIGPYVWHQYKIVILPDSFPFGGMEHPLLTFASPIIIVGDKEKSGVGTAVHEIAHSWVGNMVTGKDWSNMWIMEGFCRFVERKCYETVRSKDYATIERINGKDGLTTAIASFTKPEDHSFKSLHPYTENRNPDDATSSIPYEKGALLLYYIEQQVGEATFKQLLQDYIQKFKYTSIDEDDFYQFIKVWIPKQSTLTAWKAVDAVYKKWVYEEGQPPVDIKFQSDAYDQAVALAQAWLAAADGVVPPNADNFNTYITNQKQVFLQVLIDNYTKLNPAKIKLLDTQYKLSGTTAGPKVEYKWLRLTLLADYFDNLEPFVHNFLKKIGVRSYVIGLYTLLIQKQYDTASTWFYGGLNEFYHPLVSDKVEQMLKEK